MKLKQFIAPVTSSLLIFSGAANAVVIGFDGGTAYLNDGTSVTTTNTGLWNSVVDYYIESGIKVDFVGGYGTIGDYYNNSPSGGIGGANESVIHAHDFEFIDIVFSKVDGSAFDLSYVDMVSNTLIGGGLATGTEDSYITTNTGHSLKLASSDWGFDYTFTGAAGDGVVRNFMDSNFQGITSFTISSNNAYCFGMDNFYIDEPPPSVPEPGILALLAGGLLGMIGIRRRIQK